MVKDVIRDSILADPAMVLDDRDVVRALIGANHTADEKVVDLRSVLLRRLEGKLDQLEDTHRDVVAAAYENLAGTHQIHRAVLAVMAPSEFEGLLLALAEDLPNIMALDAIKLCIEGEGCDPGQALGPDGPFKETVVGMPKGGTAAYCGEKHLSGSGHRVILRRATRAATLIYGDEADTIHSEAILKLDFGAEKLPGLLIFGSQDPRRFHAEQGTDLLSFLGAAFSLVMQRWLV